MILEICSVPEVLEVMRIVRIILLLIRIAVPIMLIFFASKIFIEGLVNSKPDTNLKKIVTMLISAVCVFLIPTFLNLVLSLTGNENVYVNCYANATNEGISNAYANTSNNYINTVKKTLKKSDYKLAKNYINKVKDDTLKESLLNDLEKYYEYVEINELIDKLLSKYNKNTYSEVKTRIANLEDSDEKTILEEKFKTIKHYTKTDKETDSIGTYHTNGYTGIKYYLYSQCEGSWKNINLRSDGTTFCDIGCGLTTCTVIISSYNSKVTPSNSVSFGNDGHHDTVIETQTKNNYDCTKYTNASISSPTITKSTITEAMKEGAVLSVKVYGRKKGGSSKFTSSQHFMAIIDYSEDDDQMFVGNYYGNGTYSSSGWFSSDDVLTSAKDVVICYPSDNLRN